MQINSIIQRNKKSIHNFNKIKSSIFQPLINRKRHKLARSGYDVQHDPTLKGSSGNLEKSKNPISKKTKRMHNFRL